MSFCAKSIYLVVSLSSVIVPRYLYWCTTSTDCELKDTGGREGGFFLKSTHISLVLHAFIFKKDDSHQLVKSDTTGPCSGSEPFKSETITVSSANFNVPSIVLTTTLVCVQHKKKGRKNTPLEGIGNGGGEENIRQDTVHSDPLRSVC